MTFEEASQKGMSFTTLDSIYMSGINANPELAVFSANQEEYILAYKQLLSDLGIYLKEQGFIWDGPTKAFNRIYFNKEGEIDYFLYTFRPGQLSKEAEKKYRDLLSEFIRDYKFALSAKVGFAQCSPVTYMPQQ